MFSTVKTIRLDETGREIAEWHHEANIIEVIRALDAKYPHSLIEARYTR